MAEESILKLEIEMLKKQVADHEDDIGFHKKTILDLMNFRKEFSKENGYVPKIVNQVRENVKKDLEEIKKEIIADIALLNNRISKLPCISPDSTSEELMKAAGCKIVDEGDKLYPGEKEVK